MTIQTRARDITDRLKTVYNGDKFQFDFYISQLISGDHNKELRREIIYQATGQTRPLSKCGMYAVSDTLKNTFDQLTLNF